MTIDRAAWHDAVDAIADGMEVAPRLADMPAEAMASTVEAIASRVSAIGRRLGTDDPIGQIMGQIVGELREATAVHRLQAQRIERELYGTGDYEH